MVDVGNFERVDLVTTTTTSGGESVPPWCGGSVNFGSRAALLERWISIYMDVN